MGGASKTNRDLKYQLKDLDRYCLNPAKYWQQFILGHPAPTPLPEPEPESTDWEFWQQQGGAA